MRAILVLAAAPMLIGIAASLLTQNARRASLLAALGSVVFVAVATNIRDADAVIGWLATLLVLPLPVACSIATVAFFVGRGVRPSRRHDHRAMVW